MNGHNFVYACRITSWRRWQQRQTLTASRPTDRERLGGGRWALRQTDNKKKKVVAASMTRRMHQPIFERSACWLIEQGTSTAALTNTGLGSPGFRQSDWLVAADQFRHSDQSSHQYFTTCTRTECVHHCSWQWATLRAVFAVLRLTTLQSDCRLLSALTIKQLHLTPDSWPDNPLATKPWSVTGEAF